MVQVSYKKMQYINFLIRGGHINFSEAMDMLMDVKLYVPGTGNQ